MADSNQKQGFNWGEAISQGLMAAGQGISAAGGVNNQIYTNYLESRNRNAQLQMEAERYKEQNLIQRAQLRATIGENRSQEGLRTSQIGLNNSQAQSQQALAKFYSGFGGNPSANGVDPVTGQPNMVLTGMNGKYPRFENLDSLAQKKQVENENRVYSSTDAKAITQSEQLLGKITDLKGMVGTKAEGLSYLPWALGDESGQNFQSLKKDIGNTLLYLRSGAQINEQEYKRLSAQLTQLMRREGVDKKQLERFESEFSALAGRIKSGAKWDKKSKSFAVGEEIKPSKDSLGLF